MPPAEESAFDVYRKRIERPLYRLFTAYGLDYRRWFALGMTANVFARAASLLPVVVLGVAIDALFQRGSGAAVPYDRAFADAFPLVSEAAVTGVVPATRTGQFWFSVALIVGSFLATAVLTWVYGVAANNFAHRVMHAVRVDGFEKMQRLDMTFFDEKQTGEVMSVLNNDATNLERFLDNALHNSARLVVMVGGIAVFLFALNPQLAFVTLVAVPAMGVFTLWFMRTVEPLYADQRESVGDLNTRLENALGGVELVKTTGTEDYETDRVRDASWSYFQHTMSVLRLNYVYRPGMELLAGLSFAATFVVGGLWLLRGTAPGPLTGDLSAGAFVTFLFMTQRFVTPLSEVSTIVDQYENAKASSERVFGLQDIPVHVDDAPDAVDLADPEGRVAYDDVTFAYEEAGDPVLRDVTFEVDPGETVALVGPTGAGKSTLLKLLLRLYDVTDGAVRVDGHDVRAVTLDSLREAVGYVGQDTFLFDGTVADNIRYGRFDASDEAVVAAAEAAEADEFVRNLPQGYDTRIGERGVKLSGGQRQRLSIARTMLQNPAILVLDEATSAVDTETELLIQRSLDRLTADRTTFVIAHRLSTVKDADAILVLEGGEVVERGTHEDLLAADGLYAKLWGVQAGEIEDLPAEFVERVQRRTARRGAVEGDDD